MRTEQQQALLQNGMRQMVPNLSEQQMMRMQQMYGMGMNGDLRKNAMNNRGGFQQYVPSFLITLRCSLLILDIEEHRRKWRT